MKKLLLFMLVIALAFGAFVACGNDDNNGGAEPPANGENGANGDEVFRIGFASPNLNDTFQTFIMAAAQARADQLGFTMTAHDAREDIIAQQDQVRTMIVQELDAIIVVPVNSEGMTPLIEEATAAGIPLIFVNRNPFDEDATLPAGVFYVGSQEVIAGEFQGQYLIEIMGEEGGVGILMGILANEGAVQRTAGNRNILDQFPGIEVLAEETGNWQPDQGMAIAENWITLFGDRLNAILANNDEMALGAIEALRAAGRDDVIVMGVDAIPSALDLVAAGDMAATVLQDATGQGGGAMDKVAAILGGASPPAITWVDFVLITPANVADFM